LAKPESPTGSSSSSSSSSSGLDPESYDYLLQTEDYASYTDIKRAKELLQDIRKYYHEEEELNNNNRHSWMQISHKAWTDHHEATLQLVRGGSGRNGLHHQPEQPQHVSHQQPQQEHTRRDQPTTTTAGRREQTTSKLRQDNTNPLAFFFPKSKLVSRTAEWKRLEQHAQAIQQMHLRTLLQDAERCQELYATHDGVYLDYCRQQITLETMQLLLSLAARQDLAGKIQAMVTGEKINFTEDRAVLHTALRAPASQKGTIIVDGVDVVSEVHEVLDQIKHFTEGVRSGAIRGATGKRLRNIVSVGIGGSYLGPEFLHECLKTEPEGINAALGYNLRFLSNVDPVDVERTCADLDPEETLVVIVSKTFTTAETMLNARTMRQWLWDFMGNDKEVVRKHMVACASISAKDKVEEFGIDTDNYFFRFWDWVGGRYSVCSAAGAVPISLLYGYDVFAKFLQGAHSMDEHFISAPFEKNIPVIMGLLGVWNMSFLKYKSRTTLPYAEALLKLPAHIQQLDMESNGKSMTKHGLEVDYPVGEIDFGEAGTNGQHSFYQLLHMGQTVPCDFIGFAQSQHDFCVDGESLSSHDELMANFFAQPDALANGKTADEVRAEGVPEDLIAHKVFKGNRPSLSLLLPKLTAYACGQILAIYEHRTAVQGFMWDINSFDQWGVELGKKLALDVKSHVLQARTSNEPVQDAGNPATTRLLNYYLENSVSACTCPEARGPASPTRVTRTTHKDHLYPPETTATASSSTTPRQVLP
jgi:glucose-6-phosphate isomerase